jgi:anti-anti-sigma regulatory factor
MIESTSPVAVTTDRQPPGCVLTVAKPDEVIVWLIGEIDASLGLDLATIAEHAPRVAHRVVIDGSRVTFCDTTVTHFIELTAAVMPVVVRRPSRLLADLLAATGLYQQVLVDPGRSIA